VEHPDAGAIGWHGTYRVIERPNRLVSSEVFEGYPDAESVNHLTLAERDGVTTMSVRVVHQSKENRDGHVNSGMEGGMQVSLNRIDEIVAKLQEEDE
ncbi:MAG: SRPBCC domain-containing protein, partial [Acidimicrobiia bacterium]